MRAFKITTLEGRVSTFFFQNGDLESEEYPHRLRTANWMALFTTKHLASLVIACLQDRHSKGQNCTSLQIGDWN